LRSIVGPALLRLLVVVILIAAPLLLLVTVSSSISSLWRTIALVLLGRWSRALPIFRTTPRRNVGSTGGNIVARSSSIPADPSNVPTMTARFDAALAELRHEVRVLGVEASAWTPRGTTHSHAWRALLCIRVSVHWTITRHVARAATDTTDDVSGEITLFWAVVFAVTDVAAILTDLVLVVAERTVQGGQLAELVPLVVVLTFRGRSRL
jgi:hypothetical protein